jgi:hypothetical protein
MPFEITVSRQPSSRTATFTNERRLHSISAPKPCDDSFQHCVIQISRGLQTIAWLSWVLWWFRRQMRLRSFDDSPPNEDPKKIGQILTSP